MTRPVLAGRLADGLERIEARLCTHAATDVAARLAEMIEAVQLLPRHPPIGPKAEAGRRELVSGRGARGYVAWSADDPLDDVVAVAALRSPREAGFGEE